MPVSIDRNETHFLRLNAPADLLYNCGGATRVEVTAQIDGYSNGCSIAVREIQVQPFEYQFLLVPVLMALFNESGPPYYNAGSISLAFNLGVGGPVSLDATQAKFAPSYGANAIRAFNGSVGLSPAGGNVTNVPLWSFECQFNPLNGTQANLYYEQDSAGHYFLIYSLNGKIGIAGHNGVGADYNTQFSAGALAYNQIHTIAVTFNAGVFTLFVEANNVGTINQAQLPIVPTASSFNTGAGAYMAVPAIYQVLVTSTFLQEHIFQLQSGFTSATLDQSGALAANGQYKFAAGQGSPNPMPSNLDLNIVPSGGEVYLTVRVRLHGGA